MVCKILNAGKTVLVFSALPGLIFLFPFQVCALEPGQVLVLANKNMKESKSLARYYMSRRQIPEKNLVLLNVTDRETISYDAYQNHVVQPVQQFLSNNGENDIKSIVTFYGLPLRISSPKPARKERRLLEKLENHIEILENQLRQSRGKREEKIKEKLEENKRKIRKLRFSNDRGASLDSELSLVKCEGYDLKKWVQNPFFTGFTDQRPDVEKSEVVMTSRLDGPGPATVLRIIDDSISAEKKGLHGSACFDARWEEPEKREPSGYTLYDHSIHKAARHLEKQNRMPVVFNDEQALFQEGDCPNAALYCGWYSLAEYVDAFTWQPGSVGYHIASAECRTLKSPGSNVWCKRMLEDGISATIGPVGEPYVQAFPLPDVFFRYLAEGNLTLAECYILSVPYLSWKMVLIGDPLYRVKLPD